jgi:penicillin amidase/acyl-homoserine-lactone acylase
VAALAALLALSVAFLPGPPRLPRLDALREAGQEHDVRVLRDEWGVPHVYGKTDADVAYGLAYAHAEDDFATIQGALLAARGQLASVYGREMAANDYLVALLRVWDFVDAKYELDLTPETRALCEAYAAGLNRYAALHAKDALPGLFPARGKDVVAGFVHKLPLFFGLDRALGELMGETRLHGVSRKAKPAPPRRPSDGRATGEDPPTEPRSTT